MEKVCLLLIICTNIINSKYILVELDKNDETQTSETDSKSETMQGTDYEDDSTAVIRSVNGNKVTIKTAYVSKNGCNCSKKRYKLELDSTMSQSRIEF